MQERFDVATRAICGPESGAGACLAGVATLLLGGVCLADAFVVPGLFGPLAASVLAAERLLCAARSSSTRAAAVWTGIAFGWIAVASCMLHAPLVSVGLLQWLVVLIIASSAISRVWTRLVASPTEHLAISFGFVAAAVVAQLAMLFGGTAAPLARVAAVAAMELVLIGVIRLLQTHGSGRKPRLSTLPATESFGAAANPGAGTIKLNTGVA